MVLAVLVGVGPARRVEAAPAPGSPPVPTQWVQAEPPVSPNIPVWAPMAYDPVRHVMVRFGGGSPATSVYAADTWRWDGATWTQLHPATSPAPTAGAAMVFDRATSSMVLFGGLVNDDSAQGAHFSSDTWTWDGATWTQQHPAHTPSPRVLTTMAFEPVTGTVVLFGGSDATGQLGDTWTWDGTDWTLRQPATSPHARDLASMDFDPTTDTVLLFGGQIAVAGPPTGDDTTWSWDGTTWTERPTATKPPARFATVMAFDPATNKMVLFGGDGVGSFGDTWTWDGSDWTQQQPSLSPPPRGWSTMAFDPDHNQMVLFGGETSRGLLYDTWLYTPTIATFTHPHQGDTSVDTTTPFTWPAVPGAQNYALAVGTTRFGTNLASSGLLPPGTTSFNMPDLPTGTTLYATLLTRIDSTWTYQAITFTAAAGKALFTYPTDGQTGVDTSHPFTWNTVPGAQGYLVAVGTTRYGTDLFVSAVLPPNQDSVQAPALPIGHLYATLLTQTNGTWTRYQAISFTTPPPAPATFQQPVDGQAITDLQEQLFTWRPSPAADSYILAIGTTRFGTDLVNSGILPSTQTTYAAPLNLPANKTLYATLLTGSHGVWSYQAITFTSNPQRAFIIYPTHGQNGVDISRPFQWTSVPGATGYRFMLGRSPYFYDLLDSGILPPTQTTYHWPKTVLRGVDLYATVYTYDNGYGAVTGILFRA